ncbi:protein-export chaperone SecB [Litorimonas sp. RW-G-Af-16]|uniref:protein-export chaperone SecB n=1 Tax=Litorimonas sp. RW-G-Af-16 TaxID=3241168 RepID=UPI00390C7A0A
MAKKPKKEAVPEEATPAPEAPQGPMLRVLAQYTKDCSFENPNAPESLRSGLEAPAINIGIEIGRQFMDDDTVEVTLMLRADARRKDGKGAEQVAFLAELEYAGLFAFQGVGVEEIQPMIMIECPRLLFPFARQMMAEMTQNGGYPPIMLEPPDFAAMFREELMRRAADAPTN